MKILYIITKSNWGGAQKYVYDMALAMKKRNLEVVVAFGGNGVLAEKLKENKIRTINIPNLERDVDILKELKVFKDLYLILKKEKPDIVHLNSSKIGAVGSFVARLSSIKKIIFTAHGFPFREERPFWQIFLLKLFSWLTIVFSHKTICVSEKDFIDVKYWPFVENKLSTIHNGIDTDLDIKKEDNDTNIVKIVSIGELHKNKGFYYALLTINQLKEKIKDFKYVIYSFGGDEKSGLEKMLLDLNLDNYVDILIIKEAANKYLQNFDIYFMPSIKEGLPYVLLEAGLNGLPIVASDTGGINEIVDNYKNGFLIKPKDINGFELALERLILDKSLRKEFGEYSRDKILNKFSIENMIQNTFCLYIDQ